MTTSLADGFHSLPPNRTARRPQSDFTNEVQVNGADTALGLDSQWLYWMVVDQAKRITHLILLSPATRLVVLT